MSNNWPQYTFLALLLIGMGIALSRFGELKKPDHYDSFDLLIGPGLVLFILWRGNFFAPLGWPA